MANLNNADNAYTISTVEQHGSMAGHEIGRVWIRNNKAQGCSSWRWLQAANTGLAAIEAKRLRTMTAAEIDDYYAAA